MISSSVFAILVLDAEATDLTLAWKPVRVSLASGSSCSKLMYLSTVLTTLPLSSESLRSVLFGVKLNCFAIMGVPDRALRHAKRRYLSTITDTVFVSLCYLSGDSLVGVISTDFLRPIVLLGEPFKLFY
jgi:hypothetical protein